MSYPWSLVLIALSLAAVPVAMGTPGPSPPSDPPVHVCDGEVQTKECIPGWSIVVEIGCAIGISLGHEGNCGHEAWDILKHCGMRPWACA